MVLAIEREWGQSPGWFAGLDVSDQARLIADWRVRNVAPPSAPRGAPSPAATHRAGAPRGGK